MGTNISSDTERAARTPIVFIHYGDTPYLRYTLDCARKTNPDKTVFLLGDEKNEKYAHLLGVRHVPFARFDESEELKRFSKNFKYSAGAERQKPQDIRFELFCHKRWFYLHEFMKEKRLDQCWYFDSDTLILSPLAPEERKFAAYDVTEQSNGWNMKGLIKYAPLESFTRTMNELFGNDEYVRTQEKDFEEHPDWALSDMRAYAAYKRMRHPKTIMLNTILGGETHDECICQDDGMETEYDARLKRKIKKLYFKDGNVYEKGLRSGALVKLNSINMSWVTTSLIEKVYYYKMYGTFPPFYIPLLSKLRRLPRFIKTKITKETK